MGTSTLSDFNLVELERLMDTLIAEAGKKAEDLSPEDIIDYILEHKDIRNVYQVLAFSKKRFGDFRLLTPENLRHIFTKSSDRSGKGIPDFKLYNSGKDVLLDEELGLIEFMGEEKFKKAITVMVDVFDLVNRRHYGGGARDRNIQKLKFMLQTPSANDLEGQHLD